MHVLVRLYASLSVLCWLVHVLSGGMVSGRRCLLECDLRLLAARMRMHDVDMQQRSVKMMPLASRVMSVMAAHRKCKRERYRDIITVMAASDVCKKGQVCDDCERGLHRECKRKIERGMLWL